jgi:hypothetical protein
MYETPGVPLDRFSGNVIFGNYMNNYRAVSLLFRLDDSNDYFP